jgi:SET domain-containing protein
MKKTRRSFKSGNYAIRVRRSHSGLGVFAEVPIPKGACIIEYKGRQVSKAEQEEDGGRYFFWTGRNSMIDGNIKGNVAKRINHSCAPNCESDLHNKRIYIFAVRNIKAGEELHYDYDTEYFEQHIKPHGCRCQKCAPLKKQNARQM